MMKKLIILLLLVGLPAFAFARKKAKHVADGQGEPGLQRVVLDAQQTSVFDSLYFEALSKMLQDDSREAFRLVSEALDVDSLSAPALFLRSKLYQMQNNPNSLRDAELAVRLDTANYWYGNTLGQLYLDRGRFDLAIPCYERLQRQNPTKSDPSYTLAELYLRTDSLNLCLQQLDRIEELDGVNPNLTLQKFYILQQQGKSQEAFEAYEKLIQRYPYDISYRIQLGDLQMKNGLVQQAKQTYDNAARIDPDNAYLWISQSNYLSIIGNQAEADTLVRRALFNPNLDIDSKIKILTEYLKTILRKLDREKKTVRESSDVDMDNLEVLFQTVAAMHPTSADVYKLHSSFLSAIDQDSSALVQMRFAIDLKPSEADSWSDALQLAAKIEDFDQAFELADAAKRIHPSLPAIYMVTAYIYARQERPDSVIATYEEALKNIEAKEVNLRSSIYGYLGDTYHEVGQKEKAYSCYDEALKFNDRNYTVLNNYAYFLCIEGGDLNKAENMAAKVVQQYPDEPTYLDTYAWIYYLQGNYMLAKFYQQRAMDKSGDHPTEELKQHYEAILKALEENP